MSNLRDEPGPNGKILAKVQGGTSGVRVHPNPVLGYYRVRVGGQEGWLWYLNVEVAPEAEPQSEPAGAEGAVGGGGDGARALAPASAPAEESRERPGPGSTFSP